MQDKKNGFSAIELTIIIAVLSIIGALGIPAFNCTRRMAISTAAQEAIRQIKEECETNFIYGIDKFTSSNPDKYQISASGSNSCSGGTVILTPEDTNLYPTYLYKFADSELSYNFKGQTGTSFVACNKLICGESKESPKIDLNQPFVVKDSYLERGCSAYVIVKGPTWENAEANAQKIGGHLVTINDAEENKWIVESYKSMVTYNGETGEMKKGSQYFPRAWIGLNDREEEGVYKWSSGQEVTYRGTLDSGQFSGMKETYGRFDPKTGERDDSLPLITAFIDQDIASITLGSDGNEFWFEGSWEDNWNNYTHMSDGIAEVSLCN